MAYIVHGIYCIVHGICRSRYVVKVFNRSCYLYLWCTQGLVLHLYLTTYHRRQDLELIGSTEHWNDSAKRLQEQYGLFATTPMLCRTVNLQIAVIIKRIVRTSCQTKRLPQFYLTILRLWTCFHSSESEVRIRGPRCNLRCDAQVRDVMSKI